MVNRGWAGKRCKRRRKSARLALFSWPSSCRLVVRGSQVVRSYSRVIRMPATARMESFCSPLAQFAKEEAEAKKEAANLKYKAQEYTEALAGYTKAIELCPTSPMYYGNRAACYMMLGQYQNAFQDARKSVDLDPMFTKAYQRLIKCSIILGDLATARYELNRLLTLCQDASIVEKEKKELEYLEKHMKDAEDTYRKGDFRKAIFHYRTCCDISTSCTKFKIRKAECWAALGKYEEAKEVANNILHVDMLNVDALYLRGMCLYYQDNLGKCIQLLQEVLRLAPDYSKAIDLYKTAKKLKLKAEEGNNRFKACDYSTAYNLYSEALAIDPKNVATNAKLLYNRGIAASKLKRHDCSISDWTAAINHNTNYVAKSLLRRGEAYMLLKEYHKATADFERLCRLDNSREHRRKYNEAVRFASKPKSKDYYEVLGVNNTASTDDIKKAYKMKAKLHHPDRHVDAPERDKKKEEVIFKEILEAYNVLSDPQKRSRYDKRDGLNDFAQTFGFHYGFDPSASSYRFDSDRGFSRSFFDY